MKDKAIFLEVAREKDALKIGAYKPGDVIWRYEDLPVPLAQIHRRCEELMEALNRASRNGVAGPRAVERLKSAGRMLGDALLTPAIKERLIRTEAEFLILRIDDHLVHIPWELICLDTDFLSHRFSMGRLVKTRQEIARTGARSMARPLKMWIMADPQGDLQVAGAEGLRVFQEMARVNGGNAIIEPALDSDIAPEDIRERFKDYDFVHFAGHVDYDGANPVQTGWRLSQGHFTVTDIDRMAGGAAMPTLVFSNACQSARTDAWDDESHGANGGNGGKNGSFGLSNAFLRSGVRHYVGTFWEIMDETGSHFAQEFYTHLVAGAAVGEAIRLARVNLTERFGPDICWPSYVLYGDPTTRYFRQGQPVDPPKRERIRPVEKKTALTRGALFNYSLNSARMSEVKSWLTVIALILLLGVVGMTALSFRDWLRQDAIQAEQIRRDAVRRSLVAQAERRQDRAEAMFKELAALAEGLPGAAATPPNPLTLAMVFDSSEVAGGLEKLILHALQGRIITGKTGFVLLEQESFDIIVQELIRNLRLTPPEERRRPGLLMPRLLLILETRRDGPDTLVLMRLVERDSRKVLDTLFETLDPDRRIMDQREALARNLLQKLEEYAKSEG